MDLNATTATTAMAANMSCLLPLAWLLASAYAVCAVPARDLVKSMLACMPFCCWLIRWSAVANRWSRLVELLPMAASPKFAPALIAPESLKVTLLWFPSMLATLDAPSATTRLSVLLVVVLVLVLLLLLPPPPPRHGHAMPPRLWRCSKVLIFIFFLPS